MTKLKFTDLLDEFDRQRYAEEIAFITEKVRIYAKLFELDKWTIRLVWDGVSPNESEERLAQSNPEIQADCDAEPSYRQATLTFYLDAINIKADSWEELHETIRHEMFHVPLWPLVKMAKEFIPDKYVGAIEDVDEEITDLLACLDFWESIVPTGK